MTNSPRADKPNAICFLAGGAVENPLGKRGDEQPARTLDDLVVAAQLAFHAQHAARRERLVDQKPFADGDGQEVLRPAQARHAQRGHVELLAEQLVAELKALADLSPQMNDVSRLFHVAHLMSLLWFLGFPGTPPFFSEEKKPGPTCNPNA